MNILITIGEMRPEIGGPYYTVNSLAGKLAEFGHSVTLAYLDFGKTNNELKHPMVEEVHFPGFWFKALGQNFSWSLQHRLMKLMRLKKIDVVVDNGIWLYSNYAAIMAAHRMKVPVVVAPRGLMEVGALEYHSWKKKIAWWLYQSRILKKVDMFHACSEKERKSIATLGFSNSIVVVVPNGVGIPDVRACFSERNPRVALFLSRVHQTKGVLELVHAWAKVRPEGWILKIAGNGDVGYIDRVKIAIADYGLSDQISILGHVGGLDKANAFIESQLFVLPTYTENFGVVIAEALSYGLPVITTTGAPWALLEECNAGWWVEHGQEPLEEALRAATRKTASDLCRMGERGADTVRSNFSWEVCAKQMEKALVSLLQNYKARK